MNRPMSRNTTARSYLEALLGDTELRRRLHEEAKAEGRSLSPQAVSHWRHIKKGIPAERVPLVSRVMGIPPHQLRPDLPHLFPPPTRRARG